MRVLWPLPPSFDRTYEGLKLASALASISKTEPFDRTYEGLKLVDLLVREDHDPPLLTVPMRV